MHLTPSLFFPEPPIHVVGSNPIQYTVTGHVIYDAPIIMTRAEMFTGSCSEATLHAPLALATRSSTFWAPGPLWVFRGRDGDRNEKARVWPGMGPESFPRAKAKRHPDGDGGETEKAGRRTGEGRVRAGGGRLHSAFRSSVRLLPLPTTTSRAPK